MSAGSEAAGDISPLRLAQPRPIGSAEMAGRRVAAKLGRLGRREFEDYAPLAEIA